MAKKKSGIDTKTLIIGGIILYMLTRKKQNTGNSGSPPPQTYNYPTPPPRNTQAWAAWAKAIISTAGNVASLWQPGGPFYNQPTQDIMDATGFTPPNIYDQNYGSNGGLA